MRSSRSLHHRLDRIAALQALRAMASRGELTEAQAQTAQSRDGLDQRKSEVAAKETQVTAMQGAEALDFAGWRIALAVLASLSARRDAAAETLDKCEAREEGWREQWRQDHAREERASTLARKLTRRLADKRDDAAVLEAARLRPVAAGDRT